MIDTRVCVYITQSFLVFYDFMRDRQLLIYQNTNNNKAYRALAYDEATQRLYAGEGSTKQGEI